MTLCQDTISVLQSKVRYPIYCRLFQFHGQFLCPCSSFWYDEKAYHGVWLWEDTFSLLNHSFPTGLSSLQSKLQVPLKAQISTFINSSPYVENSSFHFVNEDKCVIPTGPSIWDYLFRNGKSWQLAGLEQDDIDLQLTSMSQTTSSLTLARDWMLGQSMAADQYNITIQYSNALPMATVNSVTLSSVSHMLVQEYTPASNTDNWKIGRMATLFYSLGLAPYKGPFFSSSQESPSGGPFSRFVESAPRLHAVVSVLSAGPVTPSDGVGGSDVDLLGRICRSNGIILKPDRPAITIEAAWSRLLVNGNGPDGEVWTTYSTVGDYSWGYVFASQLSNDYHMNQSELMLPGNSQSSGVVYEVEEDFSPPSALLLFDNSHHLLVRATGSSYGVFRLYVTAPLLTDGCIVLGETDKIAPISRQRIVSIDVDSYSTLKLSFMGSPGETVKFTFAQIPLGILEALADYQQLVLSCIVPASGQPTLSAPDGHCQ